MDINLITAGENPPKDVHAVIEIPLGGVPVKYEIDKKSGALFVDRFLHTAMFYPGNYGFIPHTLSADGDPCDVLVVSQVPVVPGAVIRCRPVGALMMEDEAGGDEKILAVPVDALHPFYAGVQSYRDLPTIMWSRSRIFPALQGSGKGKMGVDRALARCGWRGEACDGRDRAREDGGRLAELAFHQAARLAEIHLAGEFAFQHADHLAHVLHARRAGFLDGGVDRRSDLGIGHLFRQIAGDDHDLVGFLLREFRPAALLVQLFRFLALLDHLLEYAGRDRHPRAEACRRRAPRYPHS